jgi:hypothetical protein
MDAGFILSALWGFGNRPYGQTGANRIISGARKPAGLQGCAAQTAFSRKIQTFLAKSHRQ